jgi:hypothetical protein
MGLLDDLTPPDSTNRCAVKLNKDKLAEQDRVKLDEAISNTKWPAATLSAELRNRGIAISRWAIADHRKGLCKCSKI